VVGTGLPVEGTVHGVALAEFDLSGGFEGSVLPADKRVIEGVDGCGDEGAVPISSDAEIDEVLLSFGWEVAKPVQRVLERGDLSIGDFQLLENLVLGHRVFLIRLLIGEGTVENACVEFSVKSSGGGRNGHSCAMESEREERVFADLTLEANLEFSFRHGVCVS